MGKRSLSIRNNAYFFVRLNVLEAMNVNILQQFAIRQYKMQVNPNWSIKSVTVNKIKLLEDRCRSNLNVLNFYLLNDAIFMLGKGLILGTCSTYSEPILYQYLFTFVAIKFLSFCKWFADFLYMQYALDIFTIKSNIIQILA